MTACVHFTRKRRRCPQGGGRSLKLGFMDVVAIAITTEIVKEFNLLRKGR